jgi:methylase of polypeptide subunit release factors
LAFWAMRSLKDHGTIYAEINASLAHDTSNLFNKEGFHSVELLRDQFGKERMIICKK